MSNEEISWRIGGQSGEGIDSTGEIFAYSMARAGLDVYTFREFPSRIRGGYTGYEVRLSSVKRPLARSNQIHCLVAFDQNSIDVNLPEMVPGGTIVYDSNSMDAQIPDAADVHVYGAPMAEMARDAGGVIMKNMVSLGITAGLLDFSVEPLYDGISMRWGAKGDKVVAANRKAIEKGLGFASSVEGQDGFELDVPEDRKSRVLLSGNDAIGFGALVAGCRYYAGYPITPATEILEWLSRRLPEYGGVVIQTEDEIAAIVSAIGAGYTGVRAMTATSGPGFSLMTEALSLAGMSEVPVVIVDAQRAGPSTGLPTKPEQSDIATVLYGSHGDFPRIVLTPGSVQDCFYLTAEAFNLAEMYQCPVILLTDQGLSASKISILPEEINPSMAPLERGEIAREHEIPLTVGEAGTQNSMFKRYSLTESGISPRSLPGTRRGTYTANSNEHDETGHTTENTQMRVKMMLKRLGKVADMGHKRSPPVEAFGPTDATLDVFGIGSVRGPVIEAVEALNAEGYKLRFIQLKILAPFPTASVREFLQDGERFATVEHNATNQLQRVLRAELGIPREQVKTLQKFDGTPFKPREVYEGLREMA